MAIARVAYPVDTGTTMACGGLWLKLGDDGLRRAAYRGG
jgi:hypothetical protein